MCSFKCCVCMFHACLVSFVAFTTPSLTQPTHPQYNAPPRVLAMWRPSCMPYEVHELQHDGTIMVADGALGQPATRMWLDGTQLPRPLPPATNSAMAVLPLGDGLIVVSGGENRVERTGTVAWQQRGLLRPWTAVVSRTELLVTEYKGKRVAVLSLATGVILRYFGELLVGPRGIALGPAGEIIVADSGVPYPNSLPEGTIAGVIQVRGV